MQGEFIMDILLYAIIILQSIIIIWYTFYKNPKQLKLVGHVNVYDQDGNMRISCIPKRTRKQAIYFKPANPKSTYIKTIAIYTEEEIK